MLWSSSPIEHTEASCRGRGDLRQGSGFSPSKVSSLSSTGKDSGPSSRQTDCETKRQDTGLARTPTRGNTDIKLIIGTYGQILSGTNPQKEGRSWPSGSTPPSKDCEPTSAYQLRAFHASGDRVGTSSNTLLGRKRVQRAPNSEGFGIRLRLCRIGGRGCRSGRSRCP